MAEWRVGRSVGRTLYLDGKLIGLVDTPELAAEIVETMNRTGRLLDEVRGQLPPGAVWVEPGRSFAMNASCEPTRLLPESGRERSLPPVRCSAVTADDGHVHRCSWPDNGREHVHHCECGTAWGEPLGASRVDPYDTKKGFTP